MACSMVYSKSLLTNVYKTWFIGRRRPVSKPLPFLLAKKVGRSRNRVQTIFAQTVYFGKTIELTALDSTVTPVRVIIFGPKKGSLIMKLIR